MLQMLSLQQKLALLMRYQDYSDYYGADINDLEIGMQLGFYEWK